MRLQINELICSYLPRHLGLHNQQINQAYEHRRVFDPEQSQHNFANHLPVTHPEKLWIHWHLFFHQLLNKFYLDEMEQIDTGLMRHFPN